MRMPDDHYAELERFGEGNASRGIRNLVRFARAYRAQVAAWLAENPENLKEAPKQTGRSRRS
jgi:hypothetical protein